ncbi:MAG TPA: signal peptidase II [Planctomycetota bacterium]|nr:signal peptidase II [Planctomycetota bacterium]HQA99844.1 signal peptidase II [Planctomycetota bacterium]
MKLKNKTLFFLIALIGSIIDIGSKTYVFKLLNATIFIPSLLFTFEYTQPNIPDWQTIQQEFQKQNITLSENTSIQYYNTNEYWLQSNTENYLLKYDKNQYKIYTSQPPIPSNSKLRSPYLFVDKDTADIVIIPKCFNLHAAFNLGAVWSTFQGQYFMLTSLSIFAIFFILYLVWKNNYNYAYQIIIGGILAGTIGNLWDRIFYGGVRDFLDCYIQNSHWPTYNLADSYIVVGIIFFCILEFKNYKKQKIETKTQTETQNM